MTKRMAISLISVFVLIGLSVWVFIGKPFTQETELKANEGPAVSNSQESKAAPKEEVVIDEDQITSVEEVVKDINEEKPEDKEVTPQLKEGSVKALDGFTEEEVEQAVQFGADYGRAALTNKYFVSGQFGDDGYQLEAVKAFAAQYYAKELVDEIDKAEGKTGSDYIDSIMPYVFYFNDNGIMSPHESCSITEGPTDETTGLEEFGERDDCFVKPVELSEMDYYATEIDGEPAIRLDFEAEQTLRLTENETGKDTSVDVTYDYIIVLTKTMDEDMNSNFVISSFDINYVLDNVQYAEAK